MQRMQTCEQDLQIGFTVAVHVTLHDGPVVNGVKFETQLASVVVELLRSDELERLLARLRIKQCSSEIVIRTIAAVVLRGASRGPESRRRK